MCFQSRYYRCASGVDYFRLDVQSRYLWMQNRYICTFLGIHVYSGPEKPLGCALMCSDGVVGHFSHHLCALSL
jgi:hypothetical protein